MKNMGTIQGSATQAVPIIINVDTVYVHTNIIPITQDAFGEPIEDLFQYEEIQYDKDEYIDILAYKNSDLEIKLTNVQLALCEIYESMEGAVK